MKRPDLVSRQVRPGIPVKLVPRDRKGLPGPLMRAQFRISAAIVFSCKSTISADS